MSEDSKDIIKVIGFLIIVLGGLMLLGCDGGWSHFYDAEYKEGKREWINYKHVKKELDLLGISLVNCDSTDAFKELEYEKYEDIVNGSNSAVS